MAGSVEEQRRRTFLARLDYLHSNAHLVQPATADLGEACYGYVGQDIVEGLLLRFGFDERDLWNAMQVAHRPHKEIVRNDTYRKVDSAYQWMKTLLRRHQLSKDKAKRMMSETVVRR